MAYDQRGNNSFDAGYGKRPRGDGNGYGMNPSNKRIMTGSQDYGGPGSMNKSEYGGMNSGNKPGRNMSYGGDYAPPPQKMQRPSGPNMNDEKPSNVLLFTVLNPKYPISVDVMHTICQPNANVLRIVIFRKNGVQAMVEFENVDDAERTKEALDGADIYSGCCTLKIQWAKPTRLNVVRNDGDSWDYTNPNLGKEPVPKIQQPLLPDPKYDQSAYGERDYGGQGDRGRMEGPPHQSRRGPPPPQQMDYGYDMEEPQPMDHYRGPPPRGGPPAPQNRFPPQRPQQPRNPYGDAYGPPRPPPPMRPAPRQPGHGPMQPMAMSEYDDQTANGGQFQQGVVMMVYGLNADKMNCQRMFNLFCVFGNVVRVKFLKSKDGVAMIQMGDSASCQRAIQHLHGNFAFGSKLELGMSKQAFIMDVNNPVQLNDGSPSFFDFMSSRNNRFSTPEAAAKNRIQPPSKTLYFYNSPPGIDEDTIRKVFNDLDMKSPVNIKVFPAKSERSSTGLIEWDNKTDALEALIIANHTELPNPNGKNPYIMKLCFSGVPMK